MKKIILFGFVIALAAFLLHQILTKPEKKLSSSDSSTDNSLTNPVQTIQKNHTAVFDREKLPQQDNFTSSTDALLAQLKAALPTFDPANPNFQELLAKLVRSDPMAAARFAETLPVGMMRNDVVRHVGQDWAMQDLASAESWAGELPDKSESQSVLADICFQVSLANAAQAVQIAGQHNLNTMPGVLQYLVSQWAAQDFSSAAAWVKTQPENQQRDQMLQRLAMFQSRTDPAEAATLVAEQMPPGPVQDDAVVSVIYNWSLRHMAGATAWVNLFPPGPLKERAESELSHITAGQLNSIQASKSAH
jgi:hypothetical protein